MRSIFTATIIAAFIITSNAGAHEELYKNGSPSDQEIIQHLLDEHSNLGAYFVVANDKTTKADIATTASESGDTVARADYCSSLKESEWANPDICPEVAKKRAEKVRVIPTWTHPE